MANRIGIVTNFQPDGSKMIDINIESYDDTAPYTYRGTDGFPFDPTVLFPTFTDDDLMAAALAAANGFAAVQGYSYTSLVKMPKSTGDVQALIAAALPATPAASALSLSLQTSTGAVGTQVSTTRDAYVMLNANVSTTATIGGASSGDIILEVAPTNSATAGDWVEWGRIGNSQTFSLALALNSVQVTKGMAVAFVPAGYYVKARTAGSGTVSYTLTNAKKILS